VISTILNTKNPLWRQSELPARLRWAAVLSGEGGEAVGSRGNTSQLGLGQGKAGVTALGWSCCWQRWRNWTWRRLVGHDSSSRHLCTDVFAATSLVIRES